MLDSVGSVWQGFGSTGRGVAVLWQLLTEAARSFLCVSKSDPLLTKAEPISHGGRGSGMTYWKRG